MAAHHSQQGHVDGPTNCGLCTTVTHVQFNFCNDIIILEVFIERKTKNSAMRALSRTHIISVLSSSFRYSYNLLHLVI